MPGPVESEPLATNGIVHTLKKMGAVQTATPTTKHQHANGHHRGRDHELSNGHANGRVNGHTNGHRAASDLDIIDIRHIAVEDTLKGDILSSFLTHPGLRALPTLLLYDERGLQIFEEITYLQEYYLTNDEISVLEKSSSQIAKHVPDGSMVIELGSGNLRKVNLLLQAIDNAGKDVDYYALDLSEEELKRTLAQLPNYTHVRCHGLLGTYDDGREWLKKVENLSRQKCVLSLGSSIGNFRRDEASEFLRGFSDVLRPGDSMLIGLDACYDPGKVYLAYNDTKGITHQFVLNGLVHANKVLGEEAFKVDDWQVIGEYVCDAGGGRHQAWFSPVRDTWVLGELIPANERVFIERSVKYTKAEREELWRVAGMIESDQWSVRNEYGLHLLTKPTMNFSLTPKEYASSAIPTIQDWEGLWAAWDTVTRGMLPQKELLEKPIRLRNACIFYLGHIPTFLDIQLNKTTQEPATEPKSYASIFERGIDPDVDNPEICHSHSEIPDEWPPAAEIIEYQERVRDRLKAMYAAGVDKIPRDVARAIWVGFEHEAMHLETLLYMLLQSDWTLPPPGVPAPDFKEIAIKARASRVPNQWFDIPASEVSIGMDDPEDGTDLKRHFGWDNEKPARRAKVSAFQAQGRPITNGEYAAFLYRERNFAIPASWAKVEGDSHGVAPNGHGTNNRTNGHTNNHSNGHVNGHSNGHTDSNWIDYTLDLPEYFIRDKMVRTVHGLVPLKYALDWPVFASYDELVHCAAWLGGRIPTFEEARSIYEHAEVLRKMDAEKHLGSTVPAVNGHLSNDGVEETPPSQDERLVGEEATPASSADDNLFIDLTGCNVGLSQWQPVPVTADGGKLAGQGQMGGVWEWTSSVLRQHEGFKPMALYPNYTADFFDEKHNIILGGSWATHPRIAGRTSFVNWYQRNYPYPWAGARLVRDVGN